MQITYATCPNLHRMHAGIRISRMCIILSPFVSMKEIRSRCEFRTHLLYRTRPFNPKPAIEELSAMPNEQIVQSTNALPSVAHLARSPPPFRAKNKLRPPRRIICGLCRTVVTRNVQFTRRHQSYSTLFAPETRSLRP